MTTAPVVALHEEQIRDHVAGSVETLNRRMDAHVATSGCRGAMGCTFCQLWAISFASIRRVLDFLEVEVPHR